MNDIEFKALEVLVLKVIELKKLYNLIHKEQKSVIEQKINDLEQTLLFFLDKENNNEADKEKKYFLHIGNI